jgi:hypothetical protein
MQLYGDALIDVLIDVLHPGARATDASRDFRMVFALLHRPESHAKSFTSCDLRPSRVTFSVPRRFTLREYWHPCQKQAFDHRCARHRGKPCQTARPRSVSRVTLV